MHRGVAGVGPQRRSGLAARGPRPGSGPPQLGDEMLVPPMTQRHWSGEVDDLATDHLLMYMLSYNLPETL